MGSTPAFNTSATTGPGGEFTLAGLRAGTYGVCVTDKRPGYTDQCQWPDLLTSITVAQGQTITAVNLQLRQSSAINIRVNDSSGVLAKLPTAAHPPHVNAGVFDVRGVFHPAPEIRRDATGISFQLNVPVELPTVLSVSSPTVNLETDQHAPIPSNGTAGGIIQHTGTGQTYTFNAISAKP